MHFTIRDATVNDIPTLRPLFPRLANFELPPRRVSEHLWEGDLALLERWGKGDADNCFVMVAVDPAEQIVGVTMTTLCEELLSHEPSAHLEVLAVVEGAEGNGIGRALIDQTEEVAQARGARSMSLHVFGNNERARGLYERVGYDEELIRCIKHF